MRADPVPADPVQLWPRRRCNCWRPAPPRIPQRGGPHRFRGYGLESWPRRNPRTSSLRLDAPGAAPGRASLTTAGRGRRSGCSHSRRGCLRSLPARPTAGSGPCASATLGGLASSPALDVFAKWRGLALRKQRSLDLLVVPVLRGAGHFTREAACAADKYSWTVLCEMEQLRAIWCWLSPREWSRRTS